ncbi:MAG: zinc transporter ZntB [Kofleriaceae bacterium]
MSTEPPSGLLHAFLLDGAGGSKRLDWAGVDAWSADQGPLWVSLDYTAADASRWLEHNSRIDPVIRDALLDPDPRPRAVAHGNHLMLIVRGINQNEGSAPEDMISIRAWIEPSRVITMRHRMSRTLRSLAADVEAGKGPRDTGGLVAQLVERVVDHVSARVDTLDDQIAACEEGAIDRTTADLRSQLADHRRRAIALRRFLAPQREALAKLAQISVGWVSDGHRRSFAEAADRMTRTVEELDAARDRAAVTHEELTSRAGELTNQRLYVLSLITAIFLPLGFVCSLLGVNIGGVPLQSASWAFWALIGVFVVGVGLQVWLFRRRGWLDRE